LVRRESPRPTGGVDACTPPWAPRECVGRGGDAQGAAAHRLQVTDALGELRYRTGRPLRVVSRAAAFTLSRSGSGMASAYADEHPVAAPVRMPRNPACALRYRLRSPCFGLRSGGCGVRIAARGKDQVVPHARSSTIHDSRPSDRRERTILHPPEHSSYRKPISYGCGCTSRSRLSRPASRLGPGILPITGGRHTSVTSVLTYTVGRPSR
jgi:hypothetical protein